MAVREPHRREEDEEERGAAAVAEEGEKCGEEGGDEEDDSCYSKDDAEEEEEEDGDGGGHDPDDLSSSDGEEEVGGSEHIPAAIARQYFLVHPEPVKLMASAEGTSILLPTAAAAPSGLALHTRRRPLASPATPRFISASLPCSRTSSPRARSGTDLMAAALQNWSQPTRPSCSNLKLPSRRRSPAATAPPSEVIGRRDLHLRRSKSCGEGRACLPPDDPDIFPKLTAFDQGGTEGVVGQLDGEEEGAEKGTQKPDPEPEPRAGEGFKCGAFCLFLPGFSKGKQVQARKEATDGHGPSAVARVVSVSKRRDDGGNAVVSRAASLEKFECGSWSSSVNLNGEEDGEGAQSYFDLPLELMRAGPNDTESPVKAAFVFDTDRRGVLKRSGSRAGPRRSHESPGRHVTFSAPATGSRPTSPTAFCISPRLRKAREEFNALSRSSERVEPSCKGLAG